MSPPINSKDGNQRILGQSSIIACSLTTKTMKMAMKMMLVVQLLALLDVLDVLDVLDTPCASAYLAPASHAHHRAFRSSSASASGSPSSTSRHALIDPALISSLSDSSTVAAAATDALTSVVATMYTATLPPLDADTGTNTLSTMKDYFIPTSSNDATMKALESFVQAKQQAASSASAATTTTLPNSSDLIQYDTVMPGAKGVANPSAAFQTKITQYSYNNQIDKRELNWIAQQFDIYLRKIPLAVTLYALLDFFVLSPNMTPDLLTDELEEDRMGVITEWVSGAAFRVGVLASIVAVIIFVENLTYHPV